MTDADREEIRTLRAQLDEVRQAFPALAESVHALSAQAGVSDAKALASERELARLGRAIDGPPHLDALRVQLATEMSTPRRTGPGFTFPSADEFRGYGRAAKAWGPWALVVVFALVLASQLYSCNQERGFEFIERLIAHSDSAAVVRSQRATRDRAEIQARLDSTQAILDSLTSQP